VTATAQREPRRAVTAPYVALTFDDGPSRFTPEILETLARHDARATFFLIGAGLVSPAGAQAARDIAAAGCEIGNHTFNHPALDTLDRESVGRELARTTLVIDHAIGAPPQYFRAPFLRLPDGGEQLALEYGLHHVGASIVPADYAWSPEQTAEHVLEAAAPGDIVLLHDGWPPNEKDGDSTSRAATVEAVGLILEGFTKRQLRAVTLSALFAVAS
jgi:peptidoglycan/xylan/chitin deacetylase (PgdA/CDA1 family)